MFICKKKTYINSLVPLTKALRIKALAECPAKNARIFFDVSLSGCCYKNVNVIRLRSADSNQENGVRIDKFLCRPHAQKISLHHEED